MLISRRSALSALAAGLTGACAWAQSNWSPSRPIRLVSGGVGGVTDIRARWLAERLASPLGQSVVVENQGAAGGNLSAEMVARSTPDGHTLLFTHQGIAAINPHVYARVAFDPLADFAPITRLGHGPLLLTVPPNLPVRTVSELVALGREKPGSLNFGSPGNGTPPHLASEMFRRMAGIEATHVPYKGGGALASAMLAGQLSFAIEGLTAQLPHVRAGTLRAIAVTGAQRSPSLPDVPTIAESGLPGYEYAGWTGVVAPAATPAPIVARLHAEIVAIASTEEARRWFAQGGADPGTQSPEAFGRFMREEHAKLGKLIRDAGIRAE